MTDPIRPTPNEHFRVAGTQYLHVVTEVEGFFTRTELFEGEPVGVRHVWIVRAPHGSRWSIVENPGEALDGILWIGTPLPADPDAPLPEAP